MSGFCSLLNCRPLISFGLNIVQYKQNFTCLISISSIDYSTSMHTSTTPQETGKGLPKAKSQSTGMSFPLPPLKGGKSLNQILSQSWVYYRGRWWNWRSPEGRQVSQPNPKPILVVLSWEVVELTILNTNGRNHNVFPQRGKHMWQFLWDAPAGPLRTYGLKTCQCYLAWH